MTKSTRASPPPAPPPGGPRFVELVRVSTQDQKDRDTPEAQNAELVALRERRPGTLVERLEFVGSGAKSLEDRTDIQRLDYLADHGGFDEVRVRHFDRIMRHPDLDVQEAIFSIIRRANAKIVEADGTEIDLKTLPGRIISMIKAEGAKEEHQKIVDRTQGNKRLAVLKGRLVQGRPPYARTFVKIDKVTGRWGIDEEEAKIYRRMFDLCLRGLSLSKIAAKLNAEGRVTRGSRNHEPRAWTGGNVSRLLRAPAAHGRYESHGHAFQLKPIVNEATFRAALAKLASNSSLSGPRTKLFALLRKIAVCGACGSPVYIQLGGRRSRIRYYKCKSRDPGCRAYHRVDAVDHAVIESLHRWLRDPGTLAAATRHDDPGVAKAAAEREIAEAEGELRNLDRQEERLARLLSKGLTPKVSEKLLVEIQQNRSATEKQLKEAQIHLDAVNREAEVTSNLAEAVAAMRRRLAHATPERWRQLVEVVFPRGGIRLHPDGRLELRGHVPVGEAVRKPSAPSGRR